MTKNVGLLSKANTLLEAGEYRKAERLYRELSKSAPPVIKAQLAFNLKLLRARLDLPCDNEAVAKLLETNSSASVDVVIPVYNALEDVKKCLNSILRNADGLLGAVIVVNDGSNSATSEWLRAFCKSRERFVLLEHDRNKGYTKAVNLGLLRSESEYVVTLNSDTIVTNAWLESLYQCISSDDRLGIVGPLSNAASWQSVPDLKDSDGGFSINTLPDNLTPENVARIVKSRSRRIFPRVPFVNGFCFMIRREVLDDIGLLDEESFPTGYGEENDYCLRAAAAGYDLAIADDTYVYHSKSKSFGHKERKRLSQLGGASLRRKHGEEMLRKNLVSIEHKVKVLDSLRDELRDALFPKGGDLPFVVRPKAKFLGKEYHIDSDFTEASVVLPYDQARDHLSRSVTSSTVTIGIHLHLFYIEMLDEFLSLLSNVRYPFSLYVSICDEDYLEKVSQRLVMELSWVTVNVKVVANRGRDVGPMLYCFGEELISHDLICHIHSKRSPHNISKRDWRHQLTRTLMGSISTVDCIVKLFEDNPKLGMLFPEYHWSLKEQIHWGTNFPVCQRTADQAGLYIDESSIALFPAGSMFWARANSLNKLFDRKYVAEDFDVEQAQVDGTLAHAIERLFGEYVAHAGYDIVQARLVKRYNLINYFTQRWPYTSVQISEQENIVASYNFAKGRRNRTVVYSAIMGGYDQPVAHEALNSSIDYVMYSNDAVDDCGFWQVKNAEIVSGMKPVNMARYIKVNPFDYIKGYDLAIWIDGNVLIKSDLKSYLEVAHSNPDIPVFGIPHPIRNCIYQEAQEVVRAKKADPDKVNKQVERYLAEGYPKNNGLIETNFMLINLRHPLAERITKIWSNEVMNSCHRDQLSLNYALWKVGAGWVSLMDDGMSLRDSPDFAYFGHGRNSGYRSPQRRLTK